jgi:uncharacterized membrane-anchored protein
MSIPSPIRLGQGDHPQRLALTEEMHVRRFPCFAAPAQVLQIVLYTAGQTPETVRRHAESLCSELRLPAPAAGKYFTAELPGAGFVWEQHSEFSTYTLFRPGAFSAPFAGTLLDVVPRAWLAALPGKILRATQIALLAASEAEPSADWLAQFFAAEELVCCDVLGGEARIWSNFRLHEDGLGRLLIRDQSLVGNADPARLVQRLQELGNYRNMALLGLPLAQKLTPTLSTMEQQLADLSQDVSARAEPDEKLLHRLTSLCADLAGLQASSSYRMSATKAYAQLVADRLASLQVRRVRGFQTLDDFTDRRLTPAVRTCASFTQRLEDLSQRASWASSLMRTRIETILEHQTRDLLVSMNRRAQVQLRLQQAVEGLSVVAIGYYAVGMLGYIAKSLNHYIAAIDPTVIMGAAAPIVVLGTWWLMRRVHRSLGASDERSLS